ncbi:MAG: universal stress protein [Anaerolineales bacterium]
MTTTPAQLAMAVTDFRRARREAALQELLARLTGRTVDLLSFEEVRAMLRARTTGRRELREVPLDAIVGSVGRHSDFTRSFLPLRDSDRDRWAGVKAAVASLEGLPPIEVYQLGNAYFVLDGNHRVSVARTLGARHIEAYVTTVHARVELDPTTTPDKLICQAQYAEFLETTGLDRLRPGADLTTSIPGQYRTLREHIDVHRYFMGLDEQRDVTYEEAVAHWYDTVYLTVINVLHESGALWEFPTHTETDLYLLLAEHRARLEERLGWTVSTESVAADLGSNRGGSVTARVVSEVRAALVPDELEGGPPPGEWRRELVAARDTTQLFHDILVALPGTDAGWAALEAALTIAEREGATVLGLHVEQQPGLAGAAGPAVQAEFEGRCAAASVAHGFAVEAGSAAQQICSRARWTDLVVVPVAHPPGHTVRDRLSSGLSAIIRRCARPILAVPAGTGLGAHPLLAYNGSPKADEALYVATYLAGA